MSPGDPIDPSDAPTSLPVGAAGARPLPMVARDLVKDVQDLVTQEIDLAKAEVSDTIVRAAKAVAMFVLAGVLGLYLLDFALETIARALEGPLPDWAAWLVVTLLILVLMVVLALVGKGLLPKESPGTAAKAELEATKVAVNQKLAEVKQSFQGQQAELGGDDRG